jgi:hypothetical protein
MINFGYKSRLFGGKLWIFLPENRGNVDFFHSFGAGFRFLPAFDTERIELHQQMRK